MLRSDSRVSGRKPDSRTPEATEASLQAPGQRALSQHGRVEARARETEAPARQTAASKAARNALTPAALSARAERTTSSDLASLNVELPEQWYEAPDDRGDHWLPPLPGSSAADARTTSRAARRNAGSSAAAAPRSALKPQLGAAAFAEPAPQRVQRAQQQSAEPQPAPELSWRPHDWQQERAAERNWRTQEWQAQPAQHTQQSAPQARPTQSYGAQPGLADPVAPMPRQRTSSRGPSAPSPQQRLAARGHVQPNAAEPLAPAPQQRLGARGYVQPSAAEPLAPAPQQRWREHVHNSAQSVASEPAPQQRWTTRGYTAHDAATELYAQLSEQDLQAQAHLAQNAAAYARELEQDWQAQEYASQVAEIDFEPLPEEAWPQTDVYRTPRSQAAHAVAAELQEPSPESASQVSAIEYERDWQASATPSQAWRLQEHEAYASSAVPAQELYEQTPLPTWPSAEVQDARPTTVRPGKRRRAMWATTACVVVAAAGVLGYSAARVQSWREKHPDALTSTNAASEPSELQRAARASAPGASAPQSASPIERLRQANPLLVAPADRDPNAKADQAQSAQPPTADQDTPSEPSEGTGRSQRVAADGSSRARNWRARRAASAAEREASSTPERVSERAQALANQAAEQEQLDVTPPPVANEPSQPEPRAAAALEASNSDARASAAAQPDATSAQRAARSSALPPTAANDPSAATSSRGADAAPTTEARASAANPAAAAAPMIATASPATDSRTSAANPAAAAARTPAPTTDTRASAAVAARTSAPTTDTRASAANPVAAAPMIAAASPTTGAQASAANPVASASPMGAAPAPTTDARASAANPAAAAAPMIATPARGSASSVSEARPSTASASAMFDALDRAVQAPAPVSNDSVLAMVDEVTHTPEQQITRAEQPTAAAEAPAGPQPVLTVRALGPESMPVSMSGSPAAQPTREQVRDAILAMQSQLNACAGGKHGTSYANVTIQGNGRVSYSLIDGAFAGTEAGSCIARALRATTFPSFAGPPFKVRYPLVF